MREIIYYVATSLDGYIAGPEEDISLFAYEGNGVQQYQKDLLDFDTVIMGRKTYEFGYKFGLQPGAPAYPHMRHYIFSSSMVLENADEKVKVVPMNLDLIHQLKAEEGTPIYLCGGGEFAAWLLEHDLIDVLKVKLNPIVLGGGTPLFGSSTKAFKGRLESSENYEGGLMFNTYRLKS